MAQILYENGFKSIYESEFNKNNPTAYDFMMSDLREKIQKELDKRGWTITTLSNKSGVPQPTIWRFLKDKHDEPRSATIKKIAAGFGITEAELRGLAQGVIAGQLEGLSGVMEAQTSNHESLLRHVPIVGKAQLGDNGFWCDMEYPTGQGDGYIKFPTEDDNAYALRCVGDSMRPRVKNGEFVIIEPNTPWKAGDEVLIKSTGGKVMVKTFLYDRDGALYFQSINENHPSISIAKDEIAAIHHVVAIVKSARWVKY